MTGSRPGGLRRLLAACLSVLTLAAHATEAPTVRTPQGEARGVVLNEGRTAAFLGLPFAQPPLDALRFAAPRPAAPWQGVRDATRFQPACMQQGKVPAEIGMSEDCLYLNVYVPAGTARDAALPVLVFFHGGRYWSGRASENPVEFLAAQAQAIVVTVAYRLNAFGFLATDAPAQRTHANAGVQDQQMALRWLAANVRAFGGDPSKLTLFGESAGGGSVLMHLLARDSTGLFTNAILQSPWQWRLPTLREATEGTRALARTRGCATDDDNAMRDCLRRLPADRLLPTLAESHAFQPTVDGRLLQAQPLALLQAGRFHRQAGVMLGLNADEGHFMAMSRSGWKKPDEAVPDAAYLKAVREALQPFYGDAQVDEVLSWYAPLRAAQGNWQALSRLLGDFYLNCGSYGAARAIAQHSRRPAFAYWFDHVSANQPKRFLGAAHGTELDFLFGTQVYPPAYALTADDQALSRRMMAAWGAFARTGRPAPDALPLSARDPQAHVWAQPPRPQPHAFGDPDGRCTRWQPLLR